MERSVPRELQGPKSLGPPRHAVNLSVNLSPGFSTTDARLPLFRPPRSGSVKDPFAAGTVENRRSLSTIPARCCTNPCACEPYVKRPQHRFPDCADGRGQPTSPLRLFHRFGLAQVVVHEHVGLSILKESAPVSGTLATATAPTLFPTLLTSRSLQEMLSGCVGSFRIC
jgi:hypothetical protein